MMGRRECGQGQFFYAFDLDKVVPADHLVRQIDGVLDLDWVHKELAPYYSHTGRPSIDPVLMIRMLLVGYVFAIRSERQLCSEVRVWIGAPFAPNRRPRLTLLESLKQLSRRRECCSDWGHCWTPKGVIIRSRATGSILHHEPAEQNRCSIAQAKALLV